MKLGIFVKRGIFIDRVIINGTIKLANKAIKAITKIVVVIFWYLIIFSFFVIKIIKYISIVDIKEQTKDNNSTIEEELVNVIRGHYNEWSWKK